MPHEEEARGEQEEMNSKVSGDERGQVMWCLLHFTPNVMEEHWRI